MGLTERHWFEDEDVPENYERALEDAINNTVPVVRCKDCKYAVPALNGFYEEGFKCENEHTPGYESFWWFRPDWFCAGGEKKITK